MPCWEVNAQFSGTLPSASVRGSLRAVERECASVYHSPIVGIMRLFERIANTRMARSKDPVPGAIAICRIKLNVHEFVHIPQDQHIAVQLHHTVILFQGERRQLAPAVVESWVIAEVFVDRGQQVIDPLLRYLAYIESSMAFLREGVRVECNQWVFRSEFLEGVIKSEEA